jgi:hypothetical protein
MTVLVHLTALLTARTRTGDVRWLGALSGWSPIGWLARRLLSLTRLSARENGLRPIPVAETRGHPYVAIWLMALSGRAG